MFCCRALRGAFTCGYAFKSQQRSPVLVSITLNKIAFNQAHTNNACVATNRLSLPAYNLPRLYSSVKEVEKKPEKYEKFYIFPHIKLMRIISRMKIYQTGLTLLILPYVGVMYSTGDADQSQVVAAFGIATFAGGMLYVMSHYFRRLIGIMAINEGRDTVRVSHLTFWGKRMDIFVPVEDIVPLSELPDSQFDVYIKFCRYSSEDFLYYSLKYGRLLDREIFQEALGHLP